MFSFEGLGFSLRTGNLDRLADFYCSFLEITQSGPGWRIFGRDKVQLTLWQQDGFRVRAAASLQMCFYVADLEETCRILNDTGPLTPIHHASHGREAFLTDPDGNVLIFYEPKTHTDSHRTTRE